MEFWQFALILILQVWLLWRSPTPWRTDAVLRRVFAQLNRIEAHLRGVPLTSVEQEADDWWETQRARKKGRPWFS
jgi:hypothetical protein